MTMDQHPAYEPGTIPEYASPKGEPRREEDMLLGEILLRDEHLRAEQLERAWARQRDEGGLLGEILVRLEAIDEDALFYLRSRGIYGELERVLKAYVAEASEASGASAGAGARPEGVAYLTDGS